MIKDIIMHIVGRTRLALSSALTRSTVAGRKKVPGPRSSLLDALTGLLAELGHFWHDGLALSSCSRGMKSPHSVRRRPARHHD